MATWQGVSRGHTATGPDWIQILFGLLLIKEASETPWRAYAYSTTYSSPANDKVTTPSELVSRMPPWVRFSTMRPSSKEWAVTVTVAGLVCSLSNESRMLPLRHTR